MPDLIESFQELQSHLKLYFSIAKTIFLENTNISYTARICTILCELETLLISSRVPKPRLQFFPQAFVYEDN